jgi:ankyrin repeat protein
VTRTLLEAGANPNHASNIWLDRPLHTACHREACHRNIPVLLEYGADAAASSRLRDSPLEFAASRNFAVTVEALFAATPPWKHTKAVIAAIKSHALASLSKLMELGANCDGVDASGKTILHYAAIYADEPTIELLALYKQNLPGAHTVDSCGRTSADYAAARPATELRRGIVESLLTGGTAEIGRVFTAEGLDESDNECDSELEFEDAVEEIIPTD